MMTSSGFQWVRCFLVLSLSSVAADQESMRISLCTLGMMRNVRDTRDRLSAVDRVLHIVPLIHCRTGSGFDAMYDDNHECPSDTE